LIGPPATTLSEPLRVTVGTVMAALVNCRSRSCSPLSESTGSAGVRLSLRRPTSLSVAPPLVAMVTAPPKSLAAEASSTLASAAVSTVNRLVPVTVSAPVWVMLPRAVTSRLPPTEEVPRTSALLSRTVALLAPVVVRPTAR
jgi:hypothetical protein